MHHKCKNNKHTHFKLIFRHLITKKEKEINIAISLKCIVHKRENLFTIKYKKIVD